MALLLLLALTPALWGQACPDGYTCIPDDTYTEIYGKLDQLVAIEEGLPSISFDGPFVLITDEKNRVYSNATGDHVLPGKITWGHMSADVEMVVDVSVRRKEPPLYGFRMRPKMTFGWLPLKITIEDPMQSVDVGVDLDFVYWRKWNLSAYLGGRTFGADAGFDIFSNSGVCSGVRWAWPFEGYMPAPTPVIGWYFAF